MSSKIRAFIQTAARLLPVLFIPAILLLTGCLPAGKTQAYNIKCTLAKTDGTTESYEFYKGFIVNDPTTTEQLENGTIPACTLIGNNYEIAGTAGPYAPLNFSWQTYPSSYSGAYITIADTDKDVTEWSLDHFELEIVNNGSSTVWECPSSAPQTLTVLQAPGSVGDVFEAEFTATVEDDNSNQAALTGSFYLKRMADGI